MGVFSLGWSGMAAAQDISVDDVILAVLIGDFKVDDYEAQIIVGQGSAHEKRGSIVYQKSGKLRMTYTEDGVGSPLNIVIVSDGLTLTVFDNDAGTVEHQSMGLDPLSMDFRALYYLCSRSPIFHWTFSDGSTTQPVDPGNQYDLSLRGADLDIRVRVDVALRAMVEIEVDGGGGTTVVETWSDFSLVDSVYLPGRRTIKYLGNTRIDIFSGYAINQNPTPDLFLVP